MEATGANDWVLNAVGSRVQDFYAEMGVELPGSGTQNVKVRCFSNPQGHSHGDRNASCSVSVLDGRFKCFGCSQAGGPYQAAIALGCSTQRALELTRKYGLFLETDKPKKRLPTDKKFRAWRDELQAQPLFLERLYELKGWTPEAIRSLGIGWDGERLTFRIREPKPKVRGMKVIGIARYFPGAKKKMLAEGKRSLFPPPEVCLKTEPLFLVEGEPAAVSVRSLGLQAVGVPGVSSWRFEWAPRLAPFNVVILPDCDPQGRELAVKVAQVLPKARIVDLEPNRSDGYDVGDLIAEAAQEDALPQVRRLLMKVAA